MPKTKDQYCQLGYISVAETAANTLTFAGLSVFSNVLAQKGMVISRIEYLLSNTSMSYLEDDNDALMVGLSGDDGLSSIDLDDPSVYDIINIMMVSSGTPGTIIRNLVPIVKDFSQMPGGGLLVPADRVYGYIQGTSLAGGGSVRIRFWYRIIDFTAQEYLELAQSLRVLR